MQHARCPDEDAVEGTNAEVAGVSMINPRENVQKPAKNQENQVSKRGKRSQTIRCEQHFELLRTEAGSFSQLAAH